MINTNINKQLLKSYSTSILFVLLVCLVTIPSWYFKGGDPITINYSLLFIFFIIWLSSVSNSDISITKLNISAVYIIILFLIPVFFTHFLFSGFHKIILIAVGSLYVFSLQQFKLNLKQSNNILLLSLIPCFILSTYEIINFPNVSSGNVIFYLFSLTTAAWIITKINHLEFICIFIPIFALPIIILQQSWLLIGFTLFLVLLGLPNLYKHSTFKLYAWLGSVICGVILGISLLWIKNLNFNLFLYNFNYEQAKSIINLGLNSPYLGYGYGYFDAIFTKISAYQHFLTDINFDSLDKLTNNTLIFIMEGGYIALIALIYLSYSLFRIFKAHTWSLTLSRVAVFIPILLSIFITDTFSKNPSLIFIIASVVYYLDIQRYKKTITLSLKGKRIYKTIISLICFTSIMFLLNNIYIFKSITSKQTAPDFLIKIDPLKSNYETLYYNQFFIKSITEKNRIDILNYISWAENKINLSPSSDLYLKIIVAYNTLGNKEKVLYYISRGHYFYPNNTDFIRLSDKPENIHSLF